MSFSNSGGGTNSIAPTASKISDDTEAWKLHYDLMKLHVTISLAGLGVLNAVKGNNPILFYIGNMAMIGGFLTAMSAINFAIIIIATEEGSLSRTIDIRRFSLFRIISMVCLGVGIVALMQMF